MIQKGFCIICGRRFDADPHREHDEIAHKDCRETSIPRILKNLGTTNKSI